MFKCEIVADSVTPAGKRLTTLVATYPRCVHCFDDQTEVLCEYEGRRQFLPWRVVALRGRDAIKIAAYNRDGTITFETPMSIIASPYKGRMVQVETQRLSFCVTPEHRLYVGSRKRDRDEWEIILACQLVDGTQKRFKAGGLVADGTEVGHTLSQLIGFFVGDGTLPVTGNQAVFHLRKKRKIKYLRQLLDALGIRYVDRLQRDGTHTIVFDRLPVFTECYGDDRVKRVPDCITKGTVDDIEAFLYGIWFSDGSTDKGALQVFNTYSPDVACQLGSLAAMCGRRINLNGPYDRCYKLNSCEEIEPIYRRDKSPSQLIDYDGYIYCATVSTGLLVVRRDGKAHVSGNSEVLTHRDRERNSASSRAIPWPKMCEMIATDPFVPIRWGSEQKGMQTGAEIDNPAEAERIWLKARDNALASAQELANLGVHKSLVNRLTEPFMWITVIMSATEWKNFFRLRCHSDAEIHFQQIAGMMRSKIIRSEPTLLQVGEWHLPYITDLDRAEAGSIDVPGLALMYPEVLARLSVARIARVSYLTHDGVRDVRKDLTLFDRLVNGSGFGHWSPHGHVAQAHEDPTHRSGPFVGYHQYRKGFANECADNE